MVLVVHRHGRDIDSNNELSVLFDNYLTVEKFLNLSLHVLDNVIRDKLPADLNYRAIHYNSDYLDGVHSDPFYTIDLYAGVDHQMSLLALPLRRRRIRFP